jgi:histidyl-tRNA synthetase
MSLDKLEKIGQQKVMQELVDVRGFDQKKAEKLLETIDSSRYEGLSVLDKIQKFQEIVGKTTIGKEGLDELTKIVEYLRMAGVDEQKYTFDPSLARGLAHYTGPIWEFEVIDGGVGSIGGCGRYDNIIGDYLGEGMKIPATGGSFGIERVTTILKDQQLVDLGKTTTDVMVTRFEEDNLAAEISVAKQLRENGIAVLLYPDAIPLGKQFKYADKKSIPLVIVIGPDEQKAGVVQIKDMVSGKQEQLKLDEVIERLASGCECECR